jgi:hypothetical protein
MKRITLGGLALALLLGISLWPGQLQARSMATFAYSIDEVWPTAVRFLRIDRSCPIREKDEASGYIMFDYPEGSKTYKGSLELIRATDADGRTVTKVAIALPDLPRHYEQMLLEKLGAKLRDERGSPPARSPRGSEGENRPRDAGSP